ncbi:tetratricopeptide repeat protein [uncultured Flavobacterium sp.]|uniref:tetratricopeptide repeat protein n=1 Tax=uncultured Flavobacterium sp. TaxID=165435 RepID=UPI0025E84356|nr:tetratricopeptide repeat protein [uncultured Flavobacterium sp.]
MKKNYFLLILTLALLPFIATAQDEDKIKAIGDEACECTKEINSEQVRDSIVSKINSCIESGILMDQVKRGLWDTTESIKETLEAENDTIVDGNQKIVITIDENFDEIQAYMFENCSWVKTLMRSNDVQSKYSMSKNKKALQFYREGEDYYSKQEYSMAIVSFNKAVKKDPKFAFAWDNLGLCYRKRGNYKEAIKCYEKSLEVDPTGRMPLQNLAVAYEYLKDYKKSAEVFDKFIAQYPNDPEGYYGGGRAHYIAGNYAEGVDKVFKAYVMYGEIQSPYIGDAEQLLGTFYNDLKEKGKSNIFIEAAKNNNIQITE